MPVIAVALAVRPHSIAAAHGTFEAVSGAAVVDSEVVGSEGAVAVVVDSEGAVAVAAEVAEGDAPTSE